MSFAADSGTLALRHGYVLIVGPDGAGKTTVADAIERDALACGVRVTRSHWHPAVVFGRGGSREPVTEPHAEPPRGAVGSFAKALVVFVDFGIGWVVSWARARRRGLLLVERGWFDQVVDPRRYRLSPRVVPLLSAAGACFPRADLTVVLGGDPERVAARKPELSDDEVARQQVAWRRIAGRAGRRVVELDAVAASPVATEAEVRGALATSLPSPERTWKRAPLAPRRLDLRVTDGRAALPALGIYRTSRPRAHVAAFANRGLLVAGAAPRAASPVTDLADLSWRIGVDLDGIAAMRSRGLARWVVGFAAGGSLRVVAKIGPIDDAALRREASVLVRLAGIARPFRAPTIRWAGEWQDRFVIATEAMLGARRTADLSADHVADIAVALATGIGDAGPLVHGDFTSWNFVFTDSGLALLDWEWSRDGFEPMVDLAHFVLQQGALLHRFGAHRAAALLTAEDSPGWRYCERVGVAPSSAPSLVLRALERRESTGSHFTRELVKQLR